MSSKISPLGYITDHLKSLTDQRTGQPGRDDIWWFLGFPASVTIGLIYFGFGVDSTSIKTFVGGLAVFVGLLFNAMVIMVNTANRYKEKPHLQPHQEKTLSLIRKIVAHIAFCIFISIVAIGLMFLTYIEGLPIAVDVFIDSAVTFILVLFSTTFLMIMKRSYLIVTKELN